MFCKDIAGKRLAKWIQCPGRTSAGSLVRNPLWQVPLGWRTDLHTHTLHFRLEEEVYNGEKVDTSVIV